MINMTEYAKRRKELMRSIGKEGIVILPSAMEMPRNGDAHYPFRQNSDFYYLTGFEEPEAVLVLLPKRSDGEYILFNRERNRDNEIWDGPRAGQLGARKQFLADESFPIDELEKGLPELLEGRESIHYPLGLNKQFDKLLMRALNKVRARARVGIKALVAIVDIATLHEMRLFKSPAEIAVMQKAVDITGRAHVLAMEACQPGVMEYQLVKQKLCIISLLRCTCLCL